MAILPILRDLNKKRNYVLLKEAKANVSDTGNINKILVKNNDKRPIYVRMGEIFTGKSQERISVKSHIVMPKESIKVEVRCVYASKGINTGTLMESGGFAPDCIIKGFIVANYKDRNVEQSKVWNDVTNYCMSMREASSNIKDANIDNVFDNKQFSHSADEFNFSNDDLKGNIDKYSKQIKNIFQKVPYFNNQVGLATLDLKGVNGIECFDLKQSWKILRDDIIKKEGEKLSKEEEDSPFIYKKDKAVNSVKKILSLDFNKKVIFKSKNYKIIGLQSENYGGEIVELNNEIIHLLLIRK